MAREFYITIVFKCKIESIGIKPTDKKLSFIPKNIEITNLKVLNDEGEEQEMEQMLIQSVANIQLENLKREFREFDILLNFII